MGVEKDKISSCVANHVIKTLMFRWYKINILMSHTKVRFFFFLTICCTIECTLWSILYITNCIVISCTKIATKTSNNNSTVGWIQLWKAHNCATQFNYSNKMKIVTFQNKMVFTNICAITPWIMWFLWYNLLEVLKSPKIDWLQCISP
jgi:hypothetical protein